MNDLEKVLLFDKHMIITMTKKTQKKRVKQIDNTVKVVSSNNEKITLDFD